MKRSTEIYHKLTMFGGEELLLAWIAFGVMLLMAVGLIALVVTSPFIALAKGWEWIKGKVGWI